MSEVSRVDGVPQSAGQGWLRAIDVCEHHCIDFAVVRGQRTGAVIVRAGRGTRQDARWVEHVRAARAQDVAQGSYWHVYPSRAAAHEQAELWAAAIRGAEGEFAAGHWADISSDDGFDPHELGRYVGHFLRRVDELVGTPVGVFTPGDFWRQHVRLDLGDRLRWVCRAGFRCPGVDDRAVGVRLLAADRGGPGRHRLRAAAVARSAPVTLVEPHLVARRSDESVGAWRERWIRSSAVAALQARLNRLGADLRVDGVFGPSTDAAVRTWQLLERRDACDPGAQHHVGLHASAAADKPVSL